MSVLFSFSLMKSYRYLLFKYLPASYMKHSSFILLPVTRRLCPEQGSRKKKLWKALRVVEFVTKIIDISNICTFFINGVFPSLLYRILNIKTVRDTFTSLLSFSVSFSQLCGSISEMISQPNWLSVSFSVCFAFHSTILSFFHSFNDPIHQSFAT